MHRRARFEALPICNHASEEAVQRFLVYNESGIATDAGTSSVTGPIRADDTAADFDFPQAIITILREDMIVAMPIVIALAGIDDMEEEKGRLFETSVHALILFQGNDLLLLSTDELRRFIQYEESKNFQGAMNGLNHVRAPGNRLAAHISNCQGRMEGQDGRGRRALSSFRQGLLQNRCAE